MFEQGRTFIVFEQRRTFIVFEQGRAFATTAMTRDLRFCVGPLHLVDKQGLFRTFLPDFDDINIDYRSCSLRSEKHCLGKTMPGLELTGKGNLIFMYISSNHQLNACNLLKKTITGMEYQ